MTDFLKSRMVTVQPDVVVVPEQSSSETASPSQTVEYFAYFVFGMLEILLIARFVLKLFGANPVSGFVSFIYGLSSIFVLPFEGIFRRGVSQGVETTSYFEPGTVTAVIVYWALIWGVIKLIRIFSGKRVEMVN